MKEEDPWYGNEDYGSQLRHKSYEHTTNAERIKAMNIENVSEIVGFADTSGPTIYL